MTEVDDVVAKMKRAALDSEYWRQLRTQLPATLLHPAAPMFTRKIETRDWRLAAMAAARQGYDAGRWGTPQDCPYPMGRSVEQTYLRRSWLVGFQRGRRVQPRPDRQPLDHQPVELVTTD